MTSKNTGDLAAHGPIPKCFAVVMEHPLTSLEEDQYADMAGSVKWDEARALDQMQPGELRYFSCPSEDQPIIGLGGRTNDILSGKSRAYIFVAVKYRDRSMPKAEVAVTEACRWFSGDLEVAHICGRNLVLRQARQIDKSAPASSTVPSTETTLVPPRIEVGFALGAELIFNQTQDCEAQSQPCYSEGQINAHTFDFDRTQWRRVIYRLRDVGAVKLYHPHIHIESDNINVAIFHGTSARRGERPITSWKMTSAT